MGIPMVIFIGKVTASAIGKKSPGFALGTEIFIAAGTAIYEALAAKIANMKRLVTPYPASRFYSVKKFSKPI
jgi:hypothetical protein